MGENVIIALGRYYKKQGQFTKTHVYLADQIRPTKHGARHKYGNVNIIYPGVLEATTLGFW